MSLQLKQELEQGLSQLGLTANSLQVNKLALYLQLLHQWNKTYNLTAVNSLEEMVGRHILDSVSLAPHLQGQCFVDVGTGAGLPGLPLAILLPHLNFTLLDSASKRTRFLIQVKAQLQLQNVEVVNARVEQFNPPHLFDGVLSRAFASLTAMLEQSQHLCTNNGRFFAMKGLYPEKELRQIQKAFNVEQCHSLSIPGTDGERHLVILRRES